MDSMDDKVLLDRKKDRDRLFQSDPSNLNSVDSYQRMRYEREIEGTIYVMLLRNGRDHKQAAKQAREESDRIVKNWRVGDTIFELTRRFVNQVKVDASLSQLQSDRETI